MKPSGLREDTVRALRSEVERARSKFPDNSHLLGALMEEVGELARVLLQGEGTERMYDEAVRVACVALRIAEEGDGDFQTTEPEPNEPSAVGSGPKYPWDSV